jgi:DNA polymerase V
MMQQKLKSDGSVKEIFKAQTDIKLKRPLLGQRIPAGFPSPATDYMEGMLDLNEFLIQHQAATFFIRVGGESMVGAGIFPDDILIVDRALEPANNKIIVAVYDGEITVKRLRCEGGEFFLVSENAAYPPIRINQELDFVVWGVVTFVIHKV